MQDIEVPADPADTALQAVMPALRKTAMTGWIIIAVIGIAAIFVMTLAPTTGEKRVTWLVAPPIFGLFAMGYTAAWVRKRHESEVMPILSQAFGFSYTKSPVRYFDMLPVNFVPRGGRQTCDDLMSGSIGERRYRFIEVKTETGGKNSRTLFDGVVVEVSTRQPIPAFLIAPMAETRGFLFFKGNVEVHDRIPLLTVPGSDGQDYGLWMESSVQGDGPRLRPFVEQMLGLGTSLADGSLYSVASTTNTIFVSIRHKTELFQIGGLLATEADIMQDIRRASGQFAMPLRLAMDVMRAEDALIQKIEAAPESS